MASKGYPGTYEKGHVISGSGGSRARCPASPSSMPAPNRGTARSWRWAAGCWTSPPSAATSPKPRPGPMPRWRASIGTAAFYRSDIGWRALNADTARLPRLRLTSAPRRRQPTAMLFWAGFFLIAAGALRPSDRPPRWRISSMIMSTPAPTNSWTALPISQGRPLAGGRIWRWPVAGAGAAFRRPRPDLPLLINYSLAFIASLTLGSAVLHVIKLVLGRRRPRDDMEMGLYGFMPFAFNLDYNSFPSGHALTICCVAVIFTCVWPWLWPLWFAIAVAAGGDARAADGAFSQRCADRRRHRADRGARSAAAGLSRLRAGLVLSAGSSFEP